MKWNDEVGYITYQSSMNNLNNLLGIKTLDIVERCELIPYYTYILKFLVEKLILLGPGIDIKTILQEVFDIYDWGTDKIVSQATLDLAWSLGIETTDYYLEGTDIPYNSEYLVFCWASAFTSLIIRLKLMYSHLLYQSIDNDCHTCNNGCSVGQTTEDLENWRSGVYPEDEEYVPNASSISGSWRVNSDITTCNCSGRRE